MIQLHRPRFITLAAALALSASAALAQQAGTYTGVSEDGSDVSLTLENDPNTGQLVLTGVGMGFTALCKNSGNSLGYGIGAGAYTPLTGNVVSSTMPYANLWAKVDARFDGAGGVKGSFMANVPLYVDSSSSFKSENCGSGKTRFTGQLDQGEQAGRPAKALPAGTATVTARPAAR